MIRFDLSWPPHLTFQAVSALFSCSCEKMINLFVEYKLKKIKHFNSSWTTQSLDRFRCADPCFRLDSPAQNWVVPLRSRDVKWNIDTFNLVKMTDYSKNPDLFPRKLHFMNYHSFRTGWSFPKYTIWWFRILGWLRLNFTLCRIHVIRIWSDRWRDKFNNDLYIRRLSCLISFNMHFVFCLKKINYYRLFSSSFKSKDSSQGHPVQDPSELPWDGR